MLTQLLRTTTLASVALFGAASAQAGCPATQVGYPQPVVRLRPVTYIDHRPQVSLPKFGMHSYNNGYGERVTHVRHGGIACQLGLEPGDTVVKFNHVRLSYHGAWDEALWDAMNYHDGHIELLVRDRHTGHIVQRHIDLDPHGHVIGGPSYDQPVYEGPVGPITPKSAPVVRRFEQPRYNVGKPVVTPHAQPAPITPKTVIRHQLHKLFD